MLEVLINGVRYIPAADVPQVVPDSALHAAIAELVAIQYFREPHKDRARAWDALHALAPEIAELCSNDPKAAFDLTHPEVNP